MTKWLSPREMRGWRAYAETNNHLLAALEADLSPHGLTLGDYEVLIHLSEAPERSLRMSDLAGKLRLSPSGITRRIDGLVRSGLVERRQCPTDRRGSNAVLTEIGQEKLEQAGYPRWLYQFEGPHQWAPAEAMELALAWFRVQAMKAKRQPKDAAFLTAQFSQAVAHANSTELQAICLALGASIYRSRPPLMG